MKVKTIPSAWLHRDGRRFDCGPYTSGALEARVRLEQLAGRKQPLQDVCSRGIQGIVNAGRIKRLWVDDATHGVPFLTSTDILRSDITGLRFISHRAVVANPSLIIRTGSTLITRAGTIGRMSFARPDMDGLACSEDVLRVIPNPTVIPPGYLYAFLSSRFGVPMVVSSTYGAIIQHLEPQHIADIPIPRLGADLEQLAHDLIQGAAGKRTSAATLLRTAEIRVRTLFDMGEREPRTVWGSVPATLLQSRCDAYYFSQGCQRARRAFDSARVPEHCSLERVATVFIPGIFKRRYAGNSSFGRPYITGGDVFQLSPTSEQYLLHQVVTQYQLAVWKGTILIQEAGQLGGLIGRSVLVGRHLDGFSVSNNMVRVTTLDPADAGYLYAVLSMPEGVTLIAREAAGSSIPHMDLSRLKSLRLPWAGDPERAEIGGLVGQAIRLRDEACADETEARALVESAIEGAN